MPYHAGVPCAARFLHAMHLLLKQKIRLPGVPYAAHIITDEFCDFDSNSMHARFYVHELYV
jgi:hypothetical protein